MSFAARGDQIETRRAELTTGWPVPVRGQLLELLNVLDAGSHGICFVRDPESGQRVSRKMVWGLIPANSKTGKMEFNTFNARAETIDTSRVFGPVWRAAKRCLVVTDGFYEWRKGDKQPFAIARTKGKLTVMAGLWEEWRSKTTSERVVSCTVITTDANELIASLHDRMPVILAEEDWPKWLGEEPATDEELLALLRPFPADQMELYPVSKRVGNFRNNDPGVAERIVLVDEPSLF